METAANFDVVDCQYLPERYNYHPVLPSEDEETNVDIKVVGVNASEEAESSDEQPMHAPGRDCAICMLPVNATTQGHTGLHALGRANYMVTPCHHLFHTECLEKVMIMSHNLCTWPHIHANTCLYSG
jgi:Zn-finger protein